MRAPAIVPHAAADVASVDGPDGLR
jgi:hypothetical protein